MIEQHKDFVSGKWCDEIDVRDFIQKNYSPYEGDSSFLTSATKATKDLWDEVSKLVKKEREKGILDADTDIVSTVTSHKPGYIIKDLEQIVGLQTDTPLKRAIIPFSGLRMVQQSLEAYGYKLDPEIEKIFTKYRKTHSDGVYSVYTEEMRKARRSGIVTGLPDTYSRGRIIGDYRRVALYGIDCLIEDKKLQHKSLENDCENDFDPSVVQLREELSEQIKSLGELKEMAASYGFDIGKPAKSAKEAVQWVYFAYLAATKEQNGAAMSIGRTSTFLDIYFERDLKNGVLKEEEAQEIIDHFVIKLRIIRFLRTPGYNELFSGDPIWVTEAIGGMGEDGRTLVTKNSYRFLHTLYSLGPAPEPNLTVLYSVSLPDNFKKFCTKTSIDTSSIQYENDDIMRKYYGDDYGIACCVSAMRIGKQMQFFGARVNLPKVLLYAINGGRDEKTGDQVGPVSEPILSEYLDYDEVKEKFDVFLDWLAKLYVNILNIIHYMHDKYDYESIQMALHDRDVYRTLACGIAGLSVAADSLSAIKHAKVKIIRDDEGLAVDYEVEGDYPKYGNNDDKVDQLAVNLTKDFINALRKNKTYRGATPTQSVLTITSNVVYGKKTGSTPDGRKDGEPFAPGGNPLHGRDTKGAIASLASVAKLPYEDSMDGISNTFSIIPEALGKTQDERRDNLINLLDGYFHDKGHHLNINALDRNILIDAIRNPEEYPQLTIRVSGYAVNFVKLSREQQEDVINRTFHERI